ncbi:hypothetical protein OPQ81_008501 [Rhizoctonia solani]|nr:hypothetical protein OPQ81_008501 [Rhizoctonia solani]
MNISEALKRGMGSRVLSPGGNGYFYRPLEKTISVAMKLTLVPNTSPQFTLDGFTSSTTVLEVKMQCASRIDVIPFFLDLYYKNTRLEDYRTLGYYKIGDNSILDVEDKDPRVAHAHGEGV